MDANNKVTRLRPQSSSSTVGLLKRYNKNEIDTNNQRQMASPLDHNPKYLNYCSKDPRG